MQRKIDWAGNRGKTAGEKGRTRMADGERYAKGSTGGENAKIERQRESVREWKKTKGRKG